MQKCPDNRRCKLVATRIYVTLLQLLWQWPELTAADLSGGVPCLPIMEAGTRTTHLRFHQPFPAARALSASQRPQPHLSNPPWLQRQFWLPCASSTSLLLSPHCHMVPASVLPCWGPELWSCRKAYLIAPCFWGSPLNPSCPVDRSVWEALHSLWEWQFSVRECSSLCHSISSSSGASTNTLLAPHNNTPNPCGSFFFFHLLYFHLLRPKLLTSSPPRPSTSQAFSCTLQVLVLDIPRVLAAAGLISGAGSVFLTTWRALLQSYRFRLRGECRVPNACQKIYIKSENLIPLLTAKAWAWMCFHTKSCVFISSSEKPSPLSLLSTTVLDSPLNFIL